MEHYDLHKRFRGLYDRAVRLYEDGSRDIATYFSEGDVEFLQSIGARPQDLYDYAEDYVNEREPDWETALGVQMIRRSYFLTVQKGIPSQQILDRESLPSMGTALAGIDWLPRAIPKALAKLRGELPDTLMYGCGGDRRFFKKNDIHPLEFLQVVWLYEHNEQAIIDWVVKRAAATSGPVKTL